MTQLLAMRELAGAELDFVSAGAPPGIVDRITRADDDQDGLVNVGNVAISVDALNNVTVRNVLNNNDVGIGVAVAALGAAAGNVFRG